MRKIAISDHCGNRRRAGEQIRDGVARRSLSLTVGCWDVSLDDALLNESSTPNPAVGQMLQLILAGV